MTRVGCVVCEKTLRPGWTRTHSACWPQAQTWNLFGYDGPLPPIVPEPLPADRVVAIKLAPICYLCGKEPAVELEHVQPRSTGGSDTWSNRGTACYACNRAKGTKIELTPDQRGRLDHQQARFRAAAERCRPVEVWDDWFFSRSDEEDPYSLEELADEIENDLTGDDEMAESDARALAEHVIAEWRQTPAGAQFLVWDDLPPPTPEEQD